MGSSPLARGTLQQACHSGGADGLIPARAGNTTLCWTGRVQKWAHPRSRGEHVFCLFAEDAGLGSSPLARGTPSPSQPQPALSGLIPARAGNTQHETADCDSARAHPRSRGEHPTTSRLKTPHPGSSPLARGTPSAIFERLWCAGLIPARAGNTAGLFPKDAFYRAHPRSRGEHRSFPSPCPR